ncbi:capsular biosynthesis protein [Oceanimonas sp. CHS3-5]|uniref:capsule biosynthesis protein n=1 Tax=Oceanimonas sp. CHS3-5 TaxID=3068186 RepID=UPI00273F7444|nr:capsular biosynthesis protein [Oceanimonas sp. CHS3-5]MDP5292281.1 capsular biosynthesis protein [Oceanimonas sp. CHS3-5]
MQSALLLQGPLGPFFQHFSRFLSEQGVSVHKIHFNGGDGCWPCRGENIHYTGSLPEWRNFLHNYISENGIDTVFCYSDCREYHAVARIYCQSHNIRFFVFEEGYLRPHYITLEQHGVNAHSPWYGKLAQALPKQSPERVQHEFDIKANFKRRIYFAMRYYFSMHCCRWRFRHYVHHRHRPYWKEGIAWLKGWYTKYTHTAHDKGLLQTLADQHSKHIFLVPLQVADDFQIREHSHFNDVTESIVHITNSFATNASQNDVLLFKHHPMDRGYTNYSRLIHNLAAKHGLTGRVFYGYELPLPEVYRHCKGVVTVNSTVGMSALLHHVPTITLGKALYDVPGLTSQCSLDEFWQAPQPVSGDLFNRLRAFLLKHTQLNGSFYCRPNSTCQQIWQRLQQQAEPPIRLVGKLEQPITEKAKQEAA